MPNKTYLCAFVLFIVFSFLIVSSASADWVTIGRFSDPIEQIDLKNCTYRLLQEREVVSDGITSRRVLGYHQIAVDYMPQFGDDKSTLTTITFGVPDRALAELLLPDPVTADERTWATFDRIYKLVNSGKISIASATVEVRQYQETEGAPYSMIIAPRFQYSGPKKLLKKLPVEFGSISTDAIKKLFTLEKNCL